LLRRPSAVQSDAIVGNRRALCSEKPFQYRTLASLPSPGKRIGRAGQNRQNVSFHSDGSRELPEPEWPDAALFRNELQPQLQPKS
jgi:hypothetical protein